MAGGASGEVILPDYIKNQHAHWMNEFDPFDTYDSTLWGANPQTYNVKDEMVTASAVNPYTGVQAYDPESDLNDMDDRITVFSDTVDDIDPETVIETIVTNALAIVDDDIQDETYIQSVVDSFENRTTARFQRETGRAMASLLGGRAVMTTYFDQQLAAMEQDRRIEVDDFEAKLRLSFQDQRAQFAVDLASKQVALIQLQLTSQQAASQMVMDLGKLRIAALQDQINIDQQFDEGEARWRLNLFEYANQTLAAYNGGGPVPRPPTKGERLMQAVLSSAQIAISGGMALGSPQSGLALGGVSLLSQILLSGVK